MSNDRPSPSPPSSAPRAARDRDRDRDRERETLTPPAPEASASEQLTAAAPGALPLEPDLEALGIRCLGAWSLDKLGDLSVAELYAVAFDTGERDPAEGLMLSVADEIVVFTSALAAASAPEEWILERFASRLSTRAHVAAELHRRQREAFVATQRGAGGAR